MITGYNTDVPFEGVVFHVQTEAKGASNPLIESLVYVGGQVVAAKRASYADLLEGSSSEGPIVERVEQQHRRMIAAIRDGRLREKLAALVGEEVVQRAAAAAALTAEEAPAAGPATPPPLEAPLDDVLASTRITEGERSLDQVILDYLTSEADQEQLLLQVDGEMEVNLGQEAVMALRASSSKTGAPVAGAQVQVKLISTVAEARTLVAGETDLGGTIELSFQVPEMGTGTAALIITASSAIGSAELRHLL